MGSLCPDGAQYSSLDAFPGLRPLRRTSSGAIFAPSLREEGPLVPLWANQVPMKYVQAIALIPDPESGWLETDAPQLETRG